MKLIKRSLGLCQISTRLRLVTRKPMSMGGASGNIVPIPNEKPVHEVNKDLRSISLTSIAPKIAEGCQSLY